MAKLKPQDELEVRYPRTSNEFKKIQAEQYELFAKKQLDYGPTNIGMGKAQIEKPKDIAISTLGLVTRMNDKVSRLMNLMLNNKNPNNESIEDSLIDLANYGIMGLIVRRKKWGK
jgi:hypothetical protein